MSDYIVSARKYRPDSFETLIGQDNIAQTLKNSILRGKLAHAYLFCGPRGVGKTSTARIFAKMINCSNPSADMEPCGECESCKSFAEGRSYCIHELDAASNNGVDDIKALMDQVMVPPQVGKYGVFIIDEVHMLSQAAFNAFLKTLEEPPAHAIFILATTEKHKVLPTILSRCQTYDFNRISIMDMVRNLRAIAQKEGITVDDESLHVIAQKADGAMRDALTIFDQTVAFCGSDIHYEDVIRNLNVLDYEYSFRLVDAFLAGDHGSAMLTFDEVIDKGFNALHFVAALSSHLRDLIVSKTAGLDSLLDLPESLKERYRAQADCCSMQWLFDALGITTACEVGYRASVNQRLHIEFALMKLAFLKGVPAMPAVASAPAAPARSVVAPAVSQGSPVATAAASGSAVAPAVSSPVTEGDASSAAMPPVSPAPVAAQQPVAPTVSEGAELRARVEPSTQISGETNAAHSATAPAVSPVATAVASDSAVAPTVSQGSPVATAASSALTGGDASSTAMPPVSPAVPTASPAAEAPRRRAVRGAATLSLTSLMDESEEKKVKIVEDTSAPSAMPEDDVIMDKWKVLVAQNSSRPRLANTLANAKLSVAEENGTKVVTFEVTNESQKGWIEENLLRTLEGNFQKILNSSRVRLVVVAAQYVEVEIPYTGEEKARDLMAKNEEVKNLITDFALDAK